MKIHRLPVSFYIALTGFVFLIAGCDIKSHQEGEVFIVTNGGQNLKLGLVEVLAIPESSVEQKIKENNQLVYTKDKEFYNRWTSALDRYLKEKTDASKFDEETSNKQYQQWFDAKSYYEKIPLQEAVGRATTDADGKFVITIPKTGKYLLVARSQRQVLWATEDYYWVIWSEISMWHSDKIILSNNNLLSKLNLP